MDLKRELELFLENEPECVGHKLLMIHSIMRKPVTASVAEDLFYGWAVEGMEILSDTLDLEAEDIEMSVCREIAKSYADIELDKIKAGAYKELDIMYREALESSLRPGTKIQIRMDGKEASGKFGTIMEDSLDELLPIDMLASDDEVSVRLDHNEIISVPISRLDVIEASETPV